jgi:hypothetical protein
MMADSRVHLEVEDWVRRKWMFEEYSLSFSKEQLVLTSGGVFEFDAVSPDRRIAATISTSGATTASGKNAVGKLMKLRSDMLFLMMASVERRLMVLTERDMYELCLREQRAGRTPSGIEFVHAVIPPDLDDRLRTAREWASREVSPRAR